MYAPVSIVLNTKIIARVCGSVVVGLRHGSLKPENETVQSC